MTATGAALWRPQRDEWRAMLCVVAAPCVFALIQLLPGLQADPLYYASHLATGTARGAWPGAPYTDLNNGFQTQALGHLVASEWLAGRVPWWNHYSGVGMPLAAEYQPSAFFPLTFLLLLPRGMVLLQCALELFAGLGTYALLRQLGATRTAAAAGGIAFALNGTLAWFAHAPASVVPTLPWLLLGIEQARLGRWRLFAVAMAASLLAGFPESAYINGLFALAWFLLRLAQSRGTRWALARRILGGGALGVMVAAPQIASFLLYLPDAYLGGHVGFGDDSVLPRVSIVASLFAPYAFGPIGAFQTQWTLLAWHWGSIGGFASTALIAVAIFGALVRRDGLSALLAVWTATVVMKSFGIEPFMTLWNWVPGIRLTAFPRYAQPTWELALILLSAFGVDALQRGTRFRGHGSVVTTILAALGAAAMLWYWMRFSREIGAYEEMRDAAVASATWAIISLAATLALLRWGPSIRAARALAALLALDAALLFAVPIGSAPRGGNLDLRVVEFLRSNLGMQRFATLGPIQPNYGAYFRIASVNHNYLPLPFRWAKHVVTKMATDISDPAVFDGLRDDGAQLRANMPAYAEAGVKYVVTGLDHNPFIGVAGVHRVYGDGFSSVYEIETAKPYFAVDPACSIEPRDRNELRAHCSGVGNLVRRELFFPGWEATVNGQPAILREHGTLFQRIELPAGRSEVRFSYSPPHIGWAWLAAALGLTALFAPTSLSFRKDK